MNYKIMQDEDKLKSFINWLPDLKENETFYLSLFARKKYYKDLIKSNDKTQLKRFTANKENMFDKIKQLEISIGSYKLNNIDAPQESLVLYINPNPRCMKKATFLMGKKCWELIQNQNYNLHAEALSCIQQSKSYSNTITFDIDSKEVDLELINNIINIESYNIMETRGGYHLLINPKLVVSNIKNWYQEIKKLYPSIDVTGDMMSPVPGTIQGGFIPYFKK